MKYEIGARIRKYREMSGFSQKELAQKIGVSNSRFQLGTGNQPSRCGYSCGYLQGIECISQ